MRYTNKETEERVARIAKLLASDPDISVAQIAKKLGTQEKNVKRFMQRHGLETRGMREYREAR